MKYFDYNLYTSDLLETVAENVPPDQTTILEASSDISIKLLQKLKILE